MLTDDDIQNLPDDPAQSFAVIADKLEEFCSRAEQEREGLTQADATRCAEDIYAHLAATNTGDLFPRLEKRPPRGTDAFWEWWTEFRAAVRHYRTFILIAQKKGPLTIILNDSHRAKIHALLNRVREIVPKLQVSVAKKDNILTLIAKLESEVDRQRTRTESLWGLMLEGGAALKQLGEDAKPLVEDLERVKRVFSEAKADDLPMPEIAPPPETKKIAGPKKSRAELDDDIPF